MAKKVKDRKQAIAIALNESGKKGRSQKGRKRKIDTVMREFKRGNLTSGRRKG